MCQIPPGLDESLLVSKGLRRVGWLHLKILIPPHLKEVIVTTSMTSPAKFGKMCKTGCHNPTTFIASIGKLRDSSGMKCSVGKMFLTLAYLDVLHFEGPFMELAGWTCSFTSPHQTSQGKNHPNCNLVEQPPKKKNWTYSQQNWDFVKFMLAFWLEVIELCEYWLGDQNLIWPPYYESGLNNLPVKFGQDAAKTVILGNICPSWISSWKVFSGNTHDWGRFPSCLQILTRWAPSRSL